MVAISITGPIVARENDPPQNYPHYANIGPGGYYQHEACHAGITITFSVQGSAGMGCGSSADYYGKVTVKGTGTATHGGPVPFYYDPTCTTTCLIYETEGRQSIWITPIESDLQLTASQSVADTAMTYVTFYASIAPTLFEGSAIPWNVVRWWWVADSGAAATTVCGTADTTLGPPAAASSTCQAKVREAGTMYVEAMVNGELQTKSKHLDEVPCPILDSAMPEADTPPFRAASKSLWGTSKGDSSDKTVRRETAGFYVDSSGHKYFRPDPSPPLGACWVSNSLPPVGVTPLWEIHVHPFRRNETTPASDSTCGGRYGYGFGGPSGADWTRTVLQPQIPRYVIDKDRILRMEPFPYVPAQWDSTAIPGTSPVQWSYTPKLGTWNSHLKTAQRKKGACFRF